MDFARQIHHRQHIFFILPGIFNTSEMDHPSTPPDFVQKSTGGTAAAAALRVAAGQKGSGSGSFLPLVVDPAEQRASSPSEADPVQIHSVNHVLGSKL